MLSGKVSKSQHKNKRMNAFEIPASALQVNFFSDVDARDTIVLQ